jgi:small ligand-binding sensory domain FIST
VPEAAAFRCGHAAAPDWQAAVESVLRQLGPLPGPAGPGLVYLTEPLGAHAGPILERLRAATGVSGWAGSVCPGVMGGDAESMGEPALSVMMADWPAADWRIFSGRARAPARTEHTAAGAHAAHLALVHGDPDTPDMSGLIEDMSGKLASGFLVGGLSSGGRGGCQIAGDIVRGGLSGLVLSSAVPLASGLTQGCRPLGPRHEVTAAQGHLITAIDGRPALDVYAQAVGERLAGDWRQAVHQVLAGLPVPGHDNGDYVVRNIIGLDPRTRTLAIGAPVERGAPILFCRRDRTAAVEDLRRMLGRLAASNPTPPRGALYISCVARGENLFGAPGAELGLIREQFGRVPITGFFANGEISHNRLYAYSGVLTLFF